MLCGIKFGIAAFVDMPFPDYIWEWNCLLVRTMLSFEKLRELSYYKFQDYLDQTRVDLLSKTYAGFKTFKNILPSFC